MGIDPKAAMRIDYELRMARITMVAAANRFSTVRPGQSEARRRIHPWEGSVGGIRAFDRFI